MSTTTQASIADDVLAARKALESLKLKLHDMLHEERDGVLHAKDNNDLRWMDWHRVCIALMHVNDIDARKHS